MKKQVTWQCAGEQGLARINCLQLSNQSFCCLPKPPLSIYVTCSSPLFCRDALQIKFLCWPALGVEVWVRGQKGSVERGPGGLGRKPRVERAKAGQRGQRHYTFAGTFHLGLLLDPRKQSTFKAETPTCRTSQVLSEQPWKLAPGSENPLGWEGCWEESGGSIGRNFPARRPEKLSGAADFLLREGLDSSIPRDPVAQLMGVVGFCCCSLNLLQNSGLKCAFRVIFYLLGKKGREE